MNILLIYPRPDTSKRPRFGFSYELLTIATVLQPYHHVTIRDYSCESYDSAWISEQIEGKSFDLIVLECDSFALKRSQNLIHAKEIISLVNGRIPILAYGNYCYITKQSFDKADYTVFTNDINALIEIINELSNSSNQIPELPSYDELPYLDRSLLSHIDFYRNNQYNTLIQTAKGCENTCVFCQRKGWQSRYVTHSDDYVLGELRKIRDQGYKNVWIIDENFTFNLTRAKRLLVKFCEESLTSDMKLFISSWANIDKEFLDLAARCNIRIISFGIESGSSEILSFYRKNINLDHAVEMIQYAGSKGIFTVGNFILGAPIESEETIKKTFAVIRECKFDQINIKTLDYMIGSELYDSMCDSLKVSDHVFACRENGLTKFSLADLIKIKDDFQKEYYAENRLRIKEKICIFGSPY